MKYTFFICGLALSLLVFSCGDASKKSSQKRQAQNAETMFTPLEGKVKFMNLDPGHFHAALVQKKMYESVDPVVHVYAPDGPEVEAYMGLINRYNSSTENPTSWEKQVYKGENFFQKMIKEKPGNVMVVSGNNGKKTEYILEAVSFMYFPTSPWSLLRKNFPCLRWPFPQLRSTVFSSMI